MEIGKNDDLFISDKVDDDGFVEFCSSGGTGYPGYANIDKLSSIYIIKHLSKVFDIDLKNID